EIRAFGTPRPAARPWETGYRFALVIEFPDEKQAEQGRNAQQRSLVEIQHALRRHFTYLKNLQVAEEKPQTPNEMRYRVSAEKSAVSRAQDWPHEPVLFFVLPLRFWHSPVGDFVRFWESTLINWIGAAVALLITTIVTAFFIPNMLRKGTVDMLIVKPISRSALLLYKYIGGMTFMFLNTVIAVGGVWLVLGLRTNL